MEVSEKREHALKDVTGSCGFTRMDLQEVHLILLGQLRGETNLGIGRILTSTES